MSKVKKVANTLSKRALDAHAERTEPMRVGASLPVGLIRDAYREGGKAKAIKVGRECFQDSADGKWDGKIIAIARCEATLRGYTPAISYHDEPCATCKGRGDHDCKACRGDGFAPPIQVSKS